MRILMSSHYYSGVEITWALTVQEEDFVIHTFGIQAMLNQRGPNVSSALDDIAVAIDLLSAPEPAKDTRAAGAAHLDAADVAALLCRLRFRECLLKVLDLLEVAPSQQLTTVCVCYRQCIWQ